MQDNQGQPEQEARAPGSVLIGTAAWLLVLLAAGLLFVSFAAQYRYLYAARHQAGPAAVAALALDAGMIIFSLLALGLAFAGQAAKTERVLILACAAGSAGMNYLAADAGSPRSAVAYVTWPLFLAVVADRVIAVVRRHRLGDAGTSPWAVAGHAALYLLRLVLDPWPTTKGLRRMVLDAAPIPAHIEHDEVSGASVPDRPPLTRERQRPAAAAVAGSARVRGLAAVPDPKQDLIRELVRAGHPLPGRNALARGDHPAFYGSEATRRRIARNALDKAAEALEDRDGRASGS